MRQGSVTAKKSGITKPGTNSIVSLYDAKIRSKIQLFFLLLALLAILTVYAIITGAYDLSSGNVIRAFLGQLEGPASIVIWNIRIPRIVASIVAGWGLAISGTSAQCLLKNPLASPFTLGISHGAAFGAACSIVLLGAGGLQNSALRSNVASPLTVESIYSVTLFAFVGAMAATLVILILARVKKMSSESVILAGVALSSLFISGTILIQYFATEVELAAVVFWTFGDVSRSNWREIAVMTGATLLVTLYFVYNRWDLNALSSGEEVAKGLGVEVEKVRLCGMFASALVAAFVTAFHGVIAFLGLLAPHIARRLVGADHRFLIPHSCMIGALLLLFADTFGRVLVGSGTLPVGVLTSFMGAPLFLYLLLTGEKR